jgi:hypothetical protein
MLLYRSMCSEDFEAVSRAVQAWHRRYGAALEDQMTSVLCTAAINMFNDGMSPEEIAVELVERYPGPVWAQRQPTPSGAIH